VEAHQSAHNTLADLGEAVPETKKVTDFLAGILDPRLSGAKDLVLGDAQKLQDFESCQQYFKTLVYNKTTQEHHERQISGLKKKQPNGSNKHPVDEDKQLNVTARTYSREEWNKLTNEQRDKIKELRKSKKTRTREQVTATRNASAMGQDTDDQSEGTEDETEDLDVDSDGKDAQQDVLPPTRRNGGKAVGQGRG
jgi:hypothetical protein